MAAVQALYQMELAGLPADPVVNEFLKHRLGKNEEVEPAAEADPALFADIVRGVGAQAEDLDNMIAAVLSEEWTVERLEAVLRAILRAGAYELSARLDVPPRVTINEYMEIAEAFFSGRQPSLVNGVLDRIGHALRADEMRQGSGGRPAAAG